MDQVVITTPRIPGLEVHLPPGAVVTVDDLQPETALDANRSNVTLVAP
jgi:hypothetical protein